MFRRKVIQVATTPEPKWTLGTVTALCDDGSLWLIAVGDEEDRDWLALPPIPQHDLTPWQPESSQKVIETREMLVAGPSWQKPERQA